MPSGARYAAVYLLDQPYAIDKAYDYLIPEEYRGTAVRGCFVTVPFGAGNKPRVGLIADTKDTTDARRIKPVASVLSDGICLDDELTSLCLWVAEQTLCTVGDVVRAAVPAFAISSLTDHYRPVPDRPYTGNDPVSCEIVRAVGEAGDLTADKLADKLRERLSCGTLAEAEAREPSAGGEPSSGKQPSSAAGSLQTKDITALCRKLVRGGYLISVPVLSGMHDGVRRRLYRAAIPAEALCVLAQGGAYGGKKLRSDAHRAILGRFAGKSDEQLAGQINGQFSGKSDEQLAGQVNGQFSGGSAGQFTGQEASGDAIPESDLVEELGVTREQLKSLVAKGYLTLEEEEIYRDPIRTESAERVHYRLNDEQSAVLEELIRMSDENEAHAALLHGVTGSGKTAVMTGLLDHVLGAGGGAILLLPEISLTPQTLSIFCSRYGDRVAVIHSGLSQGERYDAYRRIREGRATLVIGTRSAVFSPVRNLELIIIDEEQEHTYKSDQNPKYHARDVARFRCAKNRALLLLASATPTVETYKKAKDGVYSLLRLTKRYGGAVLPEVRVADMRGEASGMSSTPIGGELLGEIFRVKERGEQSLLFLNRRGFNRYLSCRSCGQPVQCPNCSVAMTYHTDRGTFLSGHLVCHMCGARRQVPTACPACGSEHLARMGFGTQRIEKDLTELLPGTRLLRMDTDTTGTKDAYERMLGAFRRHEADILIGTQMITKGHDFPDVTLVGVLNADSSLFAGDWRAAEHTFSMLTQVIGRAGRGEKPGLAVIQTSDPDAEVIRFAVTQDYEQFYENEIRLRRELTFPPFCDIVLLTVTSGEESDVIRAAMAVRQTFDRLVSADGRYADVRHVVFGPFEAPVYRVEGRYRMRLVVKCVLNSRSRALFAELLRASAGAGAADAFAANSFAGIRNYSLSVDFNPSSL